MRNDLVDLTICLDRSGSMNYCRDDVIGGMNNLIKKQKKEKGTCLFSLVQFDTEYEFVHNAVDIQNLNGIVFEPRGMTALLDAVGRSINETGQRLSNMKEEDRPGLVVFVIVTDGLENSSKEFNKNQIKEMIEKQQKDYKWQFTFLGANQDAFNEAGGIGIMRTSTLKYSTDKSSEMFSVVSNNIIRMRGASASGSFVQSNYTDEERSKLL